MEVSEEIKQEPVEEKEELAIKAKDVWKDFRLFQDKNQSLKEVFLKRKRSNFETFWALKGVSFNVKKGVTLGLIGDNGSGKSTMLKILANILRPQKGDVEIEGKVSALLELGTGFHPELTGRENVYLNGSILGLSRKEIDKKFDTIVEFSELAQFIDTPVKNYSSGMYVRLGFAVSTNVDPDILLIDEILAVGDESFQRKSLDKLYQLKHEKKTIVLVSHALSSVADICDEAIWLDRGKVRKIGDARQVVDAYMSDVNRQEEERSGLDQSGGADIGNRWGSGEIVLSKVQILDSEGKERQIFESGEKMIVRMAYEARKEIERPVFGMIIHTRSGLVCSGTNSRIFGMVPEKLDGRGFVDYTIDELPLLGDEYVLTVGVHDFAGMHDFDFHDQKYVFRVTAMKNSDIGIFKAPGVWQITEE